MKFRIKKLTIVFALLISSPLYSQTDSTANSDEIIINDLLDESSTETDNSELIDVIENLTTNKIDLNTANSIELQKIPFIDFQNAHAIIAHREKYGRFFSKDELYSVDGLSKETVDKMLPFIKIDEDVYLPQQNGNNFFTNFYTNSEVIYRSRIMNDLQKREGFIDNNFSGTSIKLYNRFLWKKEDKFQFGLLTEKDAGETSLNEFTSFHFLIRDLSIIKNLVVGDYHLQFGQGLALWSPYGFSKGTNAIFPAKKEGSEITPYTSSNENNFFRGAAFETDWRQLKLSAFFSKNFFDASIDSINNSIISTPLDGYHRTISEIARRKTSNESVAGLKLGYTLPHELSIGLLYYHSSFDKAFQASSLYDRAGSNFNYYSFYYETYFSSLNIFGEISFDGKSVASINSLQFSNGKDFGFIVSIRNYPRNYTNLHGLGFGEGNNIQNEFGIYTGVKWKTYLGVINFYFDQFKMPYRSYSNPLPSNGNEFLINMTSKPFTSFETRFIYKYENKEVAANLENKSQMIRRRRQNYRFEFTKRIGVNISLKGRLEYNNFMLDETGVKEKGIMLFQEIKIIPTASLTINGRFTVFKTDSFNSAVYEYESGIPGVLSNLALYGEGMRWYLAIKYKIKQSVGLSFKYSETYKPNEKTLGTGYAMINGNVDNAILFQIDAEL
ncbi:MAG: helix-hairpin-helix domain-containing protein [Bacteroidetes bacterium]|nr:helix-hairpin-helix domain-containing protein [Bacteroidota bacterium]